MRVGDVMTPDPKTVSPTTTVADIVQILLSSRISAVPVVDEDGFLVGMVSEADLLHRPEVGTEIRRPWWLDFFADTEERAEAFLKAHGRTAEDVMTQRLAVVDENTALAVAARLMDEQRVRRLPVLRDGKVVGIVARSDLIRVLASTQPPIARFDDAEINARFRETLDRCGLAGCGMITMVVEDGVVHLWGVANSANERRALELAADEIPGVLRVENRLAVREAMPATF